MAFPQRLLHDDEDVLFDERPHWIRLIGPCALVVVVAGATVAGFVLWRSAPTWFAYVLLGAIALCAIYGASKFATWRATDLVVTTDRVVVRWGLLGRTGREIPINRVQDVTYYQRLYQRVLGAGTVTVESGGDRGIETLFDVRRPEEVQTLINRAAMAWASAPEPTRRAEDYLEVMPAAAPLEGQIAQLADLRARGIITDAEFNDKKHELLSRM